MIIPIPYEDEVFYSLIVRLKVWNGIECMTTTMNELFNKWYMKPTIDLPIDLKMFSKKTGFDKDYLIHDTTLFDYYSAFKSDRIIENALKIMYGDISSPIRTTLGLMQSPIAKPENIRFCPVCKDAEIKKYGEAYWHRLHQVPGILLCPKHKELLLDSNLSYTKINDIKTPSETICNPSHRIRRLKYKEIMRALEICHDIEWLFKNYNTIVEYNSVIQAIYKIKTDEIGLRDRMGSIDKFVNEIKIYYGENLLDIWNIRVTRSWLFFIINGFHHQTLSHILFIHFLFGSVEKLFKHDIILYNKQIYKIEEKNTLLKRASPINWEKRDLELYQKVERNITSLLENDEKITQAFFERFLGCALSQNKNNLPKTKQLIEESISSYKKASYNKGIIKIDRAIEKIAKEGGVLNKTSVYHIIGKIAYESKYGEFIERLLTSYKDYPWEEYCLKK